MVAIAQVVALPWYSLLAATSVVVFGFGLPFLSFLKPVFDKGLAKLPSYNVTEIRVVEKEVEHKAKKGRFKVEKIKEKTKSPRKLKYHSAFGTGLVAVIAAIVIFASSTPATSFGAKVDTAQYNDIYKNAIVLSWANDTLNWEVKDTAAYRVFDSARTDGGYKVMQDFEWNASRGSFIRSESNTEMLQTKPTIANGSDNDYEITPASPNNSQIELTAKGTELIREFEVSVKGDVKFTVANPNLTSTVKITLPFSFGNLASGESFSIKPISVDGSNRTVTWDYVEYSYSENDLAVFELWSSLSQYFDDHRSGDRLRGGVVYTINQ
jgi:hypothetical protein